MGTKDPDMTSIGLGGNEIIQIRLSLDETRKLLQKALSEGRLLELESHTGEVVIINPSQVKVLQDASFEKGLFGPFRSK